MWPPRFHFVYNLNAILQQTFGFPFSPQHPPGEGGLSLFDEGPLRRRMINRLPPKYRFGVSLRAARA